MRLTKTGSIRPYFEPVLGSMASGLSGDGARGHVAIGGLSDEHKTRHGRIDRVPRVAVLEEVIAAEEPRLIRH